MDRYRPLLLLLLTVAFVLHVLDLFFWTEEETWMPYVLLVLLACSLAVTIYLMYYAYLCARYKDPPMLPVQTPKDQ
jgi:hypothetical protein